MAENVLAAAKNAARLLGGWIFAAGALLAAVIFITAFVLCFCINGFGFKMRARFIAGLTCPALISGALFALGGVAAELFGAAMFLTAAYSLILLIPPVKRAKVTEEQREFARFIDSKVNSAEREKTLAEGFNTGGAVRAEVRHAEEPRLHNGDTGGTEIKKYDSPEVSALKQADENAGQNREVMLDLDFSHVRNVISRLDYFGLSQGDRKQVHDLESSLLEAERGTDDPKIKERINDGLSSLLKILSRYGA